MRFRQIVFAFFIIYFLAGITVFKDYGVNWDDEYSRYNGTTSWNYVFHHDKELLGSSEKYHGPAMELLLIGVEKLFHLTDMRDIFLAHHLVDFLVFYLAVIAFFASARILFDDDRWALLACVMLILSPRIFADSFYNSKGPGFP